MPFPIVNTVQYSHMVYMQKKNFLTIWLCTWLRYSIQSKFQESLTPWLLAQKAGIHSHVMSYVGQRQVSRC